MVKLPTKPDILDANITTGVWKAYYGNIRDFVAQLPGGDTIGQLTVSNNTVFPVRAVNELVLEEGLTKATLNTISIDNLPVGSLLLLSVVTEGVQITLKNNFGGQGSLVLFNNSDLVLTSGFTICLVRSGSRWLQMNFAGYIFGTDGVIDNQYLTKTSMDDEGLIQLCTSDEVLAGTNNNKAVTPYRLQEKIDEAQKVIKPQSLYQGLKEVPASGLVSLEDNTAIYQSAITKAITYTFDVSALTNPYSVITFELYVKMSTPFALTFPSTVTWAYGEAPDMSEAGQYLLVFRSFDGGASWIGSMEVRW